MDIVSHTNPHFPSGHPQGQMCCLFASYLCLFSVPQRFSSRHFLILISWKSLVIISPLTCCMPDRNINFSDVYTTLLLNYSSRKLASIFYTYIFDSTLFMFLTGAPHFWVLFPHFNYFNTNIFIIELDSPCNEHLCGSRWLCEDGVRLCVSVSMYWNSDSHNHVINHA